MCSATLVEFDKFRAVTWICVAWLACSAACDLLIAGLQVMYLMKHRSPVTRTDILVKKLLFYIISTGSLTSVIVTIEFSSFAALGFNFAHVFLSYSAGGVYFLSLLANLLARREMQGKYTVSSDLPSASNIVPLSIRFRPGTPPSSKDDSLMTPLDSNVHPSFVSIYLAKWVFCSSSALVMSTMAAKGFWWRHPCRLLMTTHEMLG